MPYLCGFWRFANAYYRYQVKGGQAYCLHKEDGFGHPSSKPVPLIAYLIQQCTQANGVVLDGFLGSASTLIACEQIDRTCYGIELEPKFVDVAVKRYLEFKNQDSRDVYTTSLETEREMAISELNIITEQMQKAIAENGRKALDQKEYEQTYKMLSEKYAATKDKYDEATECIEQKKSKRVLFNAFIKDLENADPVIEEFDEELWSSLVQEVIVKAKDDIVFIFKNGFEVRV